MFKILGSDQKEYGPVSAEEIRRWALDGRVDLETKAQRIGEEEWKPLSAHPEFLDLSSAGVSKGQPPPFLSAIDADAFAKTVLERSIGVGVGSCISRSWHLYKNNFGKVFLATLLVTLAASVGLFVPYCGSFIYMALQGVFYGGLYGFFLKLLRSQEAEIDDAFAGFKSFIPLMLGGAIPSLLSGLAALPFLVFSLVWFVATLSKGETGSQFSPIAVLPAVAGLGLALPAAGQDPVENEAGVAKPSGKKLVLFPEGDIFPVYVADPHRTGNAVMVHFYAQTSVLSSSGIRTGLKAGGRFGVLRLEPATLGGRSWQFSIDAGLDAMFDSYNKLDNIGWDATTGSRSLPLRPARGPSSWASCTVRGTWATSTCSARAASGSTTRVKRSLWPPVIDGAGNGGRMPRRGSPTRS